MQTVMGIAGKHFRRRGAITMQGIVGKMHAWLYRRPGRLLDAWTLVTVCLIAGIFLFCAYMWNSTWLRPLLATGGAGMAALLGPIPGMLSPDARGKWVSTTLVAMLIAAGTWFATQNLDDRLQQSERLRGHLEEQLASEGDAAAAIFAGLSPAQQDAYILQSARQYKSLYKAHRFGALRDLTLGVLQVRPDNGHALYYAGEADRWLGDRQAMINQFQNYIAASDHDPLAYNGDAAACYGRPNGFCAERLGWIEHLMANSYLELAAEAADSDKAKLLWDAFDYERQNLELVKWVRPGADQGFHADLLSKSSCDVLADIASGLARLGKKNTSVIALRKDKLGTSCGDV